jgi:B12-binding domain/radical SAM domain protein
MTATYAILIAEVITDARRRPKSKYGMNACLGALEDMSEREYPCVYWPERDESLSDLAHRVGPSYDQLVVLWSLYSTEFTRACEQLAEFRNHGSGLTCKVVHVAGGVHATAEPELTARRGFDYVAVGEGEHTTRLMVEALNAGNDLSTVPGMCWLEADSFRTSRSMPVENLDEFPTFALRQRRLGPIEITRGCIYACRFCQTPFMFKARFRHRSVTSVLDHVEWQLARGMTDVRFITPSSLSYGTASEKPDLQKVEELLSEIRRMLPDRGRLYFGSFPSEIRPEHATVEALSLVLRFADNDNVIIGAQSGSDTVLEDSHRGHDVASVIQAVENCRTVGLKANVDFIFGMPHETKRDVNDSIRLAERLTRMGARIHAHTFLPLPGTPWSHEPPGTLTAAVRATLEQLQGGGRAYGDWQAQVAQAQELAAFESYSSRRKAERNRQSP